MRNSFMKALEDLTCDHPELILILGDLGFGVVNQFAELYPKQIINAGVAEQNMTGMAAGLALSGKKVFTYSICNFTTLRPLEYLRNDVAYHDLNVTAVSVGGGFAYGSLGISHHATEDLAILRSIPNMTVFAPGDTREAYEITKCIIEKDLGPVYLRLGRAGEATIHSDESIGRFQLGRILTVIEDTSKQIALVSTGGMLEVAVDIQKKLANIGRTSSVYSVHTIKPMDTQKVVEIFTEYDLVISMEEHSIIGGLSSAMLECLPGRYAGVISHFHPFALPSIFTSIVGDQKYLRESYGISSTAIYNKLLQVIDN
jgi:transketolase